MFRIKIDDERSKDVSHHLHPVVADINEHAMGRSKPLLTLHVMFMAKGMRNTYIAGEVYAAVGQDGTLLFP